MPRVIIRDGDSGQEEPYEDVTIDCGDPYSGSVIADLNLRGGELTDMRSDGETVRLEFRIPSRDPSVTEADFTQTRGTGTLYKTFSAMVHIRENSKDARMVFLSPETGQVTSYSPRHYKREVFYSSNPVTKCTPVKSWVKTLEFKTWSSTRKKRKTGQYAERFHDVDTGSTPPESCHLKRLWNTSIAIELGSCH